MSVAVLENVALLCRTPCSLPVLSIRVDRAPVPSLLYINAYSSWHLQCDKFYWCVLFAHSTGVYKGISMSIYNVFWACSLLYTSASFVFLTLFPFIHFPSQFCFHFHVIHRCDSTYVTCGMSYSSHMRYIILLSCHLYTIFMWLYKIQDPWVINNVPCLSEIDLVPLISESSFPSVLLQRIWFCYLRLTMKSQMSIFYVMSSLVSCTKVLLSCFLFFSSPVLLARWFLVSLAIVNSASINTNVQVSLW